ncbi:MAG: glycosyltransferase family 9 protein [Melioribacteraceae bacterium]|nr:glycosyltransferase family 9 protein [Melioribacteraceae bacterium]
MKQKRILLVRPDRIGDVVLSTPIPRELKKKFPNCFIAVLLHSYTKDIYLNNPHVDKIILIDKSNNLFDKSFREKVREIKSCHFTHSLTLLPTERINYLLFFAGIPYRVGVGHKLYQYLTLTHFVSRKKYIPLRHEADYCMDSARKIGVETDDISTEIHLTKVEINNALELREKLLNGKKYLIGVHVTSGNSAPNWGPRKYAELISELKKNEDYEVIVTDNKIPDEIKTIPEIQSPNIDIRLRESFVTFKALDVLISASTGPMHLAAALNVKTVSLFCPLTACSPKLWGPMGNESRILLPKPDYCSLRCPGDPKICNFEGEDGITIDDVLESVNNFIY